MSMSRVCKQNEFRLHPEDIYIPKMALRRNRYNNNNTTDEIIEAKLCKHIGNGLPVVDGLQDLITELRLIFSSENVNVELVSYLMKSYKSNPVDWKKYAKFDRYR